jgi:very-short-patch-repair endonuclease
MPPGAGLHVAVPEGSRHLKHPVDGDPFIDTNAEVVVHWNGPTGQDSSFVPGVLPLRDALRQVLRCQAPDIAFAVVESLLANGAIKSADVDWLRHEVPGSRLVLELAGGLAGSGSESLFRFRMSLLGVLMRSQVEIPGVGWVDFVIGDRLIVEIDSREHHGGADNRLRDLERDSVAFALGYLPLRFDYSQIISDWDAVASTVCALIARGDHLAQ